MSGSRFVVEDAKLSGYLLKADHVDGASKAHALFRSGYLPEHVELLRAQLLRHAELGGHRYLVETAGRWKLIVEAQLYGPTGSRYFRTVWHQEPTQYRFITGYPIPLPHVTGA